MKYWQAMEGSWEKKNKQNKIKKTELQQNKSQNNTMRHTSLDQRFKIYMVSKRVLQGRISMTQSINTFKVTK